MDKLLEWAKAHPVWLGVGVFVVGILLLWLLGFFSGNSSASSGNSTAADYYAAETAAQSAATAQQGQAAQAQVQTAAVQASEDVAITQSNNQLGAIQAQTQYLTNASADQVTMNSANQEAAVNIAQITATAQSNIAVTQKEQAIGVANAAAITTTNQIIAAVETADLQQAGEAYKAYLASGTGGAQIGQGPSAFRQTDIRVGG